MQSTDDRGVAKNRVLRNMSRDAKHYTNNSLVGEGIIHKNCGCGCSGVTVGGCNTK
jgi:hypothetical protein